MHSLVYVGLDVHKESIAVYLWCPDTGEVVETQVPNDRGRIRKAVAKWREMGELRLCYEASGAGYVLRRWMDELGVDCQVVAPSLTPRSPGQRIKTDRGDARKLARLYAAGALAMVHVPTEEEERVRAVVRQREQLTRDISGLPAYTT